MSGSLQRLEVLLVGAIMVVAGAVVAALLYLRPPAQQSYSAATAAPVSASAPNDSVVPATAEASVPMSPAPASATATPGEQAGEVIVNPPTASLLPAPWPLLLAGGGVLGLAFVLMRIIRRRRMAYTGQSVGMLLGAADAATRAANLRVMRALHAQGALTPDLAAAAGLARRWRRPQLPPFRRPKLRLPVVKLPRLALPPRCWMKALRFDVLSSASSPREPAAPQATTVAQGAVASAPDAIPQASSTVEHGAQPNLAASAVQTQTDGNGSNAEDRALAVGMLLRTVWAAEGFRSTVLALDTPVAPGATKATVTIDVLPEEEARLADLPDLLAAQHPTWRASWSPGQPHAVLTLENPDLVTPPTSAVPLLASILHHGRGLLRSLPLDTWPHLGIYGGDALGALHGVLTALLYSQSPSALALAICDAGQVSPLYRGVPHQVDAPADVRAICDVLSGAVRHGARTDAAVRPLLLIVVEPDAEALATLTALLGRLRQYPDAPVHVILVHEHPTPAGRELYALLPALVTSGGQGAPAWLPGQHDTWPRRGATRLSARGMRLEGRPVTRTEAEVAELLAPLRRAVSDLPPVLWDAGLGPAPPVVCRQTDARDDQGQGATAEASASLAAARAESVASDGDMDSTATAEGTAPRTSDEENTMSGAGHLQTPLAAFLRAAREQPSLPSPPPQRPGEVTTGTGEHADPPPAQGSEAATLNPADETGSGWPSGPHPLGPAALHDLVARVVVSPLVTEGAANERGLTKNRLAELLRDLPKAQARDTAAVLMAWFDLAGILAPPDRPGRLRHPRVLAVSELHEIAARLAATPVPDASTVAQLWADVHEG